MDEEVSILEVGDAIAHFGRLSPPVNYKICSEARTLADVYGVMIYNRAKSIPASSLSPAQADLLRSYRLSLAPPASFVDPAQGDCDDDVSSKTVSERAFPTI